MNVEYRFLDTDRQIHEAHRIETSSFAEEGSARGDIDFLPWRETFVQVCYGFRYNLLSGTNIIHEQVSTKKRGYYLTTRCGFRNSSEIHPSQSTTGKDDVQVLGLAARCSHGPV